MPTMPAKMRPLSPHVVRLRRDVFELVQHLAHLSGLSVSEVVELALVEVLQGETADPAHAYACPAPPSLRPHRTPARVIPIARARAGHLPNRLASFREVDLPALRRNAVEVRELARQARGRAESAFRSAIQAPARATRVLSLCTR